MKIAFNSFNKEELNSVIKQFKLNEFSEGNKTKKFEKILCHYFGRKYCVCVNSGSSANFLVFKSLMLMNNFKGDKKKYSVAISGLCWPTTITAILDSGFDVFFCDVKFLFIYIIIFIIYFLIFFNIFHIAYFFLFILSNICTSK